MTFPRPRTVRARLTLFTMLVTGVLLALIIGVVDFGARRTLLGAVDGELIRQARGMARRPMRGPGGHGGPGGPPPNDARGNAIDRFRGGAANTDEIRPLDFPTMPPEGWEQAPAYDPAAVAKAKRGVAEFSRVEMKGKVYRIYTFPVLRDGSIVQVTQLPSELTNVLQSLDGLGRALLQIVLPVGVLLAGLASLLLVDRFMQPLRRIAGDAERIGATELAARLPIVGEDEFAGLSTTLNGMLTRLESAFLKERNELERQRQFTADASHELKTPLAVIKANAGLMLHVNGSPEEIREWTGEIDSATNRMTALVNDMLVLARAEAGSSAHAYAPCDLRDIAEGARRSLRTGPDGLRLDLPAAPIPILASGDDLTRVVVNLAGNALKHSGATAPIEITVRQEGDRATLTVADRGKGIAAEHLPHLFDRFYRVDVSRSSETGGTGLGLAIVKGIVEAHGGEISVRSQVGEGTRFTVSLPLSR